LDALSAQMQVAQVQTTATHSMGVFLSVYMLVTTVCSAKWLNQSRSYFGADSRGPMML